MHKNVLSGLLVVALIAVALLSACPGTTPTTAPPTTAPPTTTQPPTTPAEPQILRIGENCAQSGIFSAWDQLSSWEVDALADIINEDGGITVNGQTYLIEIVRADNQSTVDGAATAVRKLVDEEIEIAIGPSQFLASASGAIYEQNNMLHLCPWNVLLPGELDASTPMGFLCSNATVGYYITGGFAALKTIYPDAKTVVPVGADNGPDAAAVVNGLLRDTAQRNGITVLDDMVPVPDAIVDVTPIAIKLNTYKDADAYIYVNAMQTSVAGIVKALRGMGNNTPMICTTVLDGNEIVKLTGADAAINVVTAGMEAGFSGNPPILNEIYDKVEAEQGPYPMVMTSVNCLYMLKQVIEEAQSLDVNDLVAQWESMETMDTVFGPGYICGGETYGIENHAVSHPISLQVVNDGVCTTYGWIDIGLIP
jgi:ABC-type branched-subunit amino acid transport system substrate-binding protein